MRLDESWRKTEPLKGQTTGLLELIDWYTIDMENGLSELGNY